VCTHAVDYVSNVMSYYALLFYLLLFYTLPEFVI